MHTVTLTSPHSRARAKVLVDKAPEGYVVTVKPPTRSGSQNDKMWALLTDVSVSKPRGLCYTPEQWKCFFMQACGHEVQFITGIDGLPFPAGFRSSRLSKAQMSELIEFIYAWGAENGVRWSEDVR